jgi:hypothetical protein
LNPGKGKIFFSSPKRSDQLWDPASAYSVIIGGTFPGRKCPEREVDHLPASTTQVTNEWSYTATPHICLQGLERENVTFTVTVETIF